MIKILSILLMLSLGLSSFGLRVGLNQSSSFMYRDRVSIMELTINTRGGGALDGMGAEMQLQSDLKRLSVEFLTEIRTLNGASTKD